MISRVKIGAAINQFKKSGERREGNF